MKRRPFSQMRAVSLIEPLEDRIAPAGVTVAPNGRSATYTDSTGDKVSVTTTKGKFSSSQFTFDPNTPGQLMELALTGHSDFNGANILFTVLPAPGGSAGVNIGYIDATNLSLGSVTVPGDLGRIDVGGGASAMALGKLTVSSLGAEGNVTQGGPNGTFGVSTLSNITGTVGVIDVQGNVDGAVFAQDFKTRPATGNIKQLNIGGSLDGNTSTGSGEIAFTGTLGSLVIGGGIEGGSQNFFGSVRGFYAELSRIGSVTVEGSVPDDPNPNPIPSLPGTSILGGAGGLSGGISAVNIGSVYIAGDVFGGTGIASGEIQAGDYLHNVTIAGSLIGGNFTQGNPSQASSAGVIFGGRIGSLLIEKNLYGGSGLNSGEVVSTGLIQNVTVLGDVAGGSAGSPTVTGLSGVIHGQSVGSVVIGGSLIGGNLVSGDANQAGSEGGAILSDTTIGSVYIGKQVIGGTGPLSGIVSTTAGGVGKLVIGALDATSGAMADSSIIGGAGASSGALLIGGTLGQAALTHGLAGGAGANSGLISVNGPVNSLAILGSVTGGTGNNTGTISVFGLLKSASITGDIAGSSSGSTMLTNTGYIQADGIGTLTVGGGLIAGTAGAGGIDTSGAIRSTAAIGSLTLGSIIGNSTNPAVISAVGAANLTGSATTDVAIHSLAVKGSVTYADILAGYDTDTQGGTQPLGTGVNADAQIDTVTIGGNLTATNIIAGAGPGTTGFGTAGSTGLSGAGVTDLPSIISKISKVIIAGTIDPTADAGDSYGIAARYIGSVSVNGSPVALLPGPGNDTFATGKDIQLPASTGDVFLYEV
jgi:hypothetical protein